MSNTDTSHVTRTIQKAGQTQFANYVAVTTAASTTKPNLLWMGGGKDASVLTTTNLGQTAAGATSVGSLILPPNVYPSATTYSLAKSILAATSQ